MLFEVLVQATEQVRQTRSRLAKLEHLSRCVAELSRAEPGQSEGDRARTVLAGVAYLAGELPQGRIGLGPAAIFGNSPEAAAERGELTVLDVDRRLEAIGAVRGAGAVAERMRLWLGLLASATPLEQHFLQRLVVGELRQGALESLVADAVAGAARVSTASVRRAMMLSGSLPRIALGALERGEAALVEYRIELFRPLQPMLAQTAETPEEALAQLSRAVFDHKLDGVRVQVHKRGGDVRVFTRQLSDVTAAVPEVVETTLGLPSTELVLDGEVLSFGADGAALPFQTTMRRFGRKLDVDEMRRALPLRPFFFDCLSHGGQDLIDQPTTERLTVLDELVPEALRMPRIVTGDPAEASAFFEGALDRGFEGVMAKAVDAPYAAGRRGQAWLKLKSHHSFDLVVIGVEWGSGRREGWLSNLHLGARDPQGGFIMVGKTFKGLTDEVLRYQTQALLAREVRREAHVVYVRPELVVEIAFNDVQVSPHYPGGVALRFARVRRYRPDKSPGAADTIDAVRALCPGLAPAR